MLEAMEILRVLEAEDRPATPRERAVLAAYPGFGGLGEAVFGAGATDSDRRPDTAALVRDLRRSLDRETLDSAQESILNAHYTDARIGEAIWEGLVSLGIGRGAGNIRLQEPAAGVGVFLGTAPGPLRRRIDATAVEADSLSARILAALYPSANVITSPYERTILPPAFFDVTIGNVPFGNYRVHDRRYARLKPSIHDYFILRSLDHTRPGGACALITSTYTLDRLDPAIREAIADKAELIEALRLPAGTFAQSAATDVATDLLVLRRRETPISALPAPEAAAARAAASRWTELGQIEDPNGGQPIRLNRWFVEDPGRILGRVARAASGRFGPDEPEVIAVDEAGQPLRGDRLVEHVARSIAERLGRLDRRTFRPLGRDGTAELPPAAQVREGAFFVESNVLRQMSRGEAIAPGLDPRAERVMRGALQLRDRLKAVVAAQREQRPEPERAAARARLRTAYEAFVAELGPLTSRENRRVIALDPTAALVLGLEQREPDGSISLAAIFHGDTVRPYEAPATAASPADAIAVTLNETGLIDPARVAQLLDIREEQVGQALEGLAYRDPAVLDRSGKAGQLVPADLYLSGDVATKLELARAAAAADPAFARNVAALEAIQPAPIPAALIAVDIGSSWVPPGDYAAFLEEALALPAGSVTCAYNPLRHSFTLELADRARKRLESVAARRTFGTERSPAHRLFLDLLNGRPLEVADGGPDGGIDAAATAARRAAAGRLKDAFGQWIWRDPDRKERLAALYNRLHNCWVEPRLDGSHLTFPTMDPTWAAMLRDVQRRAIWRGIQGNLLIDHQVGLGKTADLIAIAMEQKRLGLRRKPAISVHLPTLSGFAGQALAMYPGAQILVQPAKDLTPEERRAFLMAAATGDWDLIIATHETLDNLPLTPRNEERFLRERIAEARSALDDAIPDGYRAANPAQRRTAKQIEAAVKRLEARLRELMDQPRRDELIYWEDLGIDQLLVDEAHKYKNLVMTSSMTDVRGLPSGESKRAVSLFQKSRLLAERLAAQGAAKSGFEQGLILATGTPLVNSVAETYVWQRYLQFDALQRAGLMTFDAWATIFAGASTGLEIGPDGRFKSVRRLREFNNLQELRSAYGQIQDYADIGGVAGLTVPRHQTHVLTTRPSAELKAYIADLGHRAAALKHGQPDDRDNMLAIATDGRMASIDLRLVDRDAADDPGSKVNTFVAQAARIAAEHPKTVQLVFLDLGLHPTKANPGFCLREDIIGKLVAAGVPRDRIADFTTASKARSRELEADLREGRRTIAIGSSARLGTGRNVQDRVYVMHDLDTPMTPKDIDQRRGRGERQGNQLSQVHSVHHVAEGTLDAFLWQLIEAKRGFIAAFRSGALADRTIRDESADEISAAQMLAIATGDPLLVLRAELRQKIEDLTRSSARARNDREFSADAIRRATASLTVDRLLLDLAVRRAEVAAGALAGPPAYLPLAEGASAVTGRLDAAAALLQAVEALAGERKARGTYVPAPEEPIGRWRGFELVAAAGYGYQQPQIMLRFPLGADAGGQHRLIPVEISRTSNLATASSLDLALRGVMREQAEIRERIARHEADIAAAQRVVDAVFPDGERLERMRRALARLDLVIVSEQGPGPSDAILAEARRLAPDREAAEARLDALVAVRPARPAARSGDTAIARPSDHQPSDHPASDYPAWSRASRMEQASAMGQVLRAHLRPAVGSAELDLPAPVWRDGEPPEMSGPSSPVDRRESDLTQLPDGSTAIQQKNRSRAPHSVPAGRQEVMDQSNRQERAGSAAFALGREAAWCGEQGGVRVSEGAARALRTLTRSTAPDGSISLDRLVGSDPRDLRELFLHGALVARRPRGDAGRPRIVLGASAAAISGAEQAQPETGQDRGGLLPAERRFGSLLQAMGRPVSARFAVLLGGTAARRLQARGLVERRDDGTVGLTPRGAAQRFALGSGEERGVPALSPAAEYLAMLDGSAVAALLPEMRPIARLAAVERALEAFERHGTGPAALLPAGIRGQELERFQAVRSSYDDWRGRLGTEETSPAELGSISLLAARRAGRRFSLGAAAETVRRGGDVVAGSPSLTLPRHPVSILAEQLAAERGELSATRSELIDPSGAVDHGFAHRLLAIGPVPLLDPRATVVERLHPGISVGRRLVSDATGAESLLVELAADSSQALADARQTIERDGAAQAVLALPVPPDEAAQAQRRFLATHLLASSLQDDLRRMHAARLLASPSARTAARLATRGGVMAAGVAAAATVLPKERAGDLLSHAASIAAWAADTAGRTAPLAPAAAGLAELATELRQASDEVADLPPAGMPVQSYLEKLATALDVAKGAVAQGSAVARAGIERLIDQADGAFGRVAGSVLDSASAIKADYGHFVQLAADTLDQASSGLSAASQVAIVHLAQAGIDLPAVAAHAQAIQFALDHEPAADPGASPLAPARSPGSPPAAAAGYLAAVADAAAASGLARDEIEDLLDDLALASDTRGDIDGARLAMLGAGIPAETARRLETALADLQRCFVATMPEAVHVPGSGPRARDNVAALQTEIVRIASRINPGVDVAFAERLFAEGDTVLRSGADHPGRQPVAGLYEHARALMSVALDPSLDPLDTAYHESWHSIERLLTADELRVLRNRYPATGTRSQEEELAYRFGAWARRRHELIAAHERERPHWSYRNVARFLGEAMLPGNLRRATTAIVPLSFADALSHPDGRVMGLRAWIADKAVNSTAWQNARMREIEARLRGDHPFDKAARLIDRVANWGRNRGFITPSDVFAKAMSGRLGRDHRRRAALALAAGPSTLLAPRSDIAASIGLPAAFDDRYEAARVAGIVENRSSAAAVAEIAGASRDVVAGSGGLPPSAIVELPLPMNGQTWRPAGGRTEIPLPPLPRFVATDAQGRIRLAGRDPVALALAAGIDPGDAERFQAGRAARQTILADGSAISLASAGELALHGAVDAYASTIDRLGRFALATAQAPGAPPEAGVDALREERRALLDALSVIVAMPGLPEHPASAAVSLLAAGRASDRHAQRLWGRSADGADLWTALASGKVSPRPASIGTAIDAELAAIETAAVAAGIDADRGQRRAMAQLGTAIPAQFALGRDEGAILRIERINSREDAAAFHERMAELAEPIGVAVAEDPGDRQLFVAARAQRRIVASLAEMVDLLDRPAPGLRLAGLAVAQRRAELAAATDRASDRQLFSAADRAVAEIRHRGAELRYGAALASIGIDAGGNRRFALGDADDAAGEHGAGSFDLATIESRLISQLAAHSYRVAEPYSTHPRPELDAWSTIEEIRDLTRGPGADPQRWPKPEDIESAVRSAVWAMRNHPANFPFLDELGMAAVEAVPDLYRTMHEIASTPRPARMQARKASLAHERWFRAAFRDRQYRPGEPRYSLPSGVVVLDGTSAAAEGSPRAAKLLRHVDDLAALLERAPTMTAALERLMASAHATPEANSRLAAIALSASLHPGALDQARDELAAHARRLLSESRASVTDDLRQRIGSINEAALREILGKAGWRPGELAITPEFAAGRVGNAERLHLLQLLGPDASIPVLVHDAVPDLAISAGLGGKAWVIWNRHTGASIADWRPAGAREAVMRGASDAELSLEAAGPQHLGDVEPAGIIRPDTAADFAMFLQSLPLDWRRLQGAGTADPEVRTQFHDLWPAIVRRQVELADRDRDAIDAAIDREAGETDGRLAEIVANADEQLEAASTVIAALEAGFADAQARGEDMTVYQDARELLDGAALAHAETIAARESFDRERGFVRLDAIEQVLDRLSATWERLAPLRAAMESGIAHQDRLEGLSPEARAEADALRRAEIARDAAILRERRVQSRRIEEVFAAVDEAYADPMGELEARARHLETELGSYDPAVEAWRNLQAEIEGLDQQRTAALRSALAEAGLSDSVTTVELTGHQMFVDGKLALDADYVERAAPLGYQLDAAGRWRPEAVQRSVELVADLMAKFEEPAGPALAMNGAALLPLQAAQYTLAATMAADPGDTAAIAAALANVDEIYANTRLVVPPGADGPPAPAPETVGWDLSALVMALPVSATHKERLASELRPALSLVANRHALWAAYSAAQAAVRSGGVPPLARLAGEFGVTRAGDPRGPVAGAEDHLLYDIRRMIREGNELLARHGAASGTDRPVQVVMSSAWDEQLGGSGDLAAVLAPSLRDGGDRRFALGPSPDAGEVPIAPPAVRQGPTVQVIVTLPPTLERRDAAGRASAIAERMADAAGIASTAIELGQEERTARLAFRAATLQQAIAASRRLAGHPLVSLVLSGDAERPGGGEAGTQAAALRDRLARDEAEARDGQGDYVVWAYRAPDGADLAAIAQAAGMSPRRILDQDDGLVAEALEWTTGSLAEGGRIAARIRALAGVSAGVEYREGDSRLRNDVEAAIAAAGRGDTTGLPILDDLARARAERLGFPDLLTTPARPDPVPIAAPASGRESDIPARDSSGAWRDIAGGWLRRLETAVAKAGRDAFVRLARIGRQPVAAYALGGREYVDDAAALAVSGDRLQLQGPGRHEVYQVVGIDARRRLVTRPVAGERAGMSTSFPIETAIYGYRGAGPDGRGAGFLRMTGDGVSRMERRAAWAAANSIQARKRRDAASHGGPALDALAAVDANRARLSRAELGDLKSAIRALGDLELGYADRRERMAQAIAQAIGPHLLRRLDSCVAGPASSEELARAFGLGVEVVSAYRVATIAGAQAAARSLSLIDQARQFGLQVKAKELTGDGRAHRATLAQYRQDLLALARRINPTVAVEFVNGIFHPPTAENVATALASGATSVADAVHHLTEKGVAGEYLAARNLARLSIDVTSFDPTDTAAHEMWHSLETLLTEAEQRALATRFPATGTVTHIERTAYAFGVWAAARVRGEPIPLDAADKHGAAPADAGSSTVALAERGFETIEVVTAGVRASLRAAGVTSLAQVDMIFASALGGDIGKRAVARDRAAAAWPSIRATLPAEVSAHLDGAYGGEPAAGAAFARAMAMRVAGEVPADPVMQVLVDHHERLLAFALDLGPDEHAAVPAAFEPSATRPPHPLSETMRAALEAEAGPYLSEGWQLSVLPVGKHLLPALVRNDHSAGILVHIDDARNEPRFIARALVDGIPGEPGPTAVGSGVEFMTVAGATAGLEAMEAMLAGGWRQDLTQPNRIRPFLEATRAAQVAVVQADQARYLERKLTDPALGAAGLAAAGFDVGATYWIHVPDDQVPTLDMVSSIRRMAIVYPDRQSASGTGFFRQKVAPVYLRVEAVADLTDPAADPDTRAVLKRFFEANQETLRDIHFNQLATREDAKRRRGLASLSDDDCWKLAQEYDYPRFEALIADGAWDLAVGDMHGDGVMALAAEYREAGVSAMRYRMQDGTAKLAVLDGRDVSLAWDRVPAAIEMAKAEREAERKNLEAYNAHYDEQVLAERVREREAEIAAFDLAEVRALGYDTSTAHWHPVASAVFADLDGVSDANSRGRLHLVYANRDQALAQGLALYRNGEQEAVPVYARLGRLAEIGDDLPAAARQVITAIHEGNSQVLAEAGVADAHGLIRLVQQGRWNDLGGAGPVLFYMVLGELRREGFDSVALLGPGAVPTLVVYEEENLRLALDRLEQGPVARLSMRLDGTPAIGMGPRTRNLMLGAAQARQLLIEQRARVAERAGQEERAVDLRDSAAVVQPLTLEEISANVRLLVDEDTIVLLRQGADFVAVDADARRVVAAGSGLRLFEYAAGDIRTERATLVSTGDPVADSLAITRMAQAVNAAGAKIAFVSIDEHGQADIRHWTGDGYPEVRQIAPHEWADLAATLSARAAERAEAAERRASAWREVAELADHYTDLSIAARGDEIPVLESAGAYYVFGAKADALAARSASAAAALATVELDGGRGVSQIRVDAAGLDGIAREAARSGLAMSIASGLDRTNWTPIGVVARQAGPTLNPVGENAMQQNGSQPPGSQIPPGQNPSGQNPAGQNPQGLATDNVLRNIAPGSLRVPGVPGVPSQPAPGTTTVARGADPQATASPDPGNPAGSRRDEFVRSMLVRRFGSDATRIAQATTERAELAGRHRIAVTLALAEGREVAPEILADYLPAEVGIDRPTAEQLAAFGFAVAEPLYLGGDRVIRAITDAQAPTLLTPKPEEALSAGPALSAFVLRSRRVADLRPGRLDHDVRMVLTEWYGAGRDKYRLPALPEFFALVERGALVEHQAAAMAGRGEAADEVAARALQRDVLSALKRAGYDTARMIDAGVEVVGVLASGIALPQPGTQEDQLAAGAEQPARP
ncbi:MAG: hypothetical protein ACT60Q_00010, partial [Ferrovibrionaceae bacterium]